jgi:hypothetical protein
MSGLQLGQQIGAMMPDTAGGNFAKGMFDPLSNLGAGVSYMAEGKVGKGLLSLLPGVGTYLQGRDKDEEDARIKATIEAQKKAQYIEATRQSSMTDLQNYIPTNNISMYPDGGTINPVPNTYIVNKSKVTKMVNGEPTTQLIDKYDTLVGQDYGYWGENLQGVNIPPAFQIDKNGKLIVVKSPNMVPIKANGGPINQSPTMILSNADIVKFSSMPRMHDALGEAKKLGATDNDLMRIAKMKYWIDGKTTDTNVNPDDTYMYNLIYNIPASEGIGRQRIPMKANGGPIPPMNIPVSGNPMTQGATQVTTPAGSTAGHHETGQNIPIVNANGQTQAIAEPGEVVADDLIISKRNGLAQEYTAIDNKKKELMAKIEVAKTPEARNGLTRSIEFLNKELERVKGEQEAISAQQQQQQQPQQGQVPVAGNGYDGLGSYDPLTNNISIPGYTPNQGYGLNTPSGYMSIDGNQPTYITDPNQNPNVFASNTSNSSDTPSTPFNWSGALSTAKQIGGYLLPSIMNYKNQAIMQKSMDEIANYKPTLNKINYIEPDYQVGDQVAAINNNFATMNGIADKVSNPLTASSVLASAGADRAQKLNEVYGAKNRADAETYARNTMMGNQVSAQNTSIMNQDSAMKLENRLGLNNAQINLNNTTVSNIQTMIQEGNLNEKDKLTLRLAMQQLNQYGVVDRKLLPDLEKLRISVPAHAVK